MNYPIIAPCGGLSQEEIERRMQEPLDPELEGFVVNRGILGWMVDHPLVSAPSSPAFIANDAYSVRKELLDRALDLGDWSQVVRLHEKPYRIDAFVKYVAGRDFRLVDANSDLRELVTDIWTGSESISEDRALWAKLFRGWLPGSGLLLATEEGRDKFELLPESLVVFRGSRGEIVQGVCSWTTSEQRAIWYARRFGGGGYLARGMVTKSAVMGFVSEEDDEELIVDASHVTNMSLSALSD